MSLDVAQSASPVVTSHEQLLDVFRRAEKPRAAFRVGMEHEKVVVRAAAVAPVPYEGPQGIGELLRRFGRFGYAPFEEAGRPIAARVPGKTISLEPGGQLELSGRPFACVRECAREQAEHVAQARALGRELGLRFLALGYAPFGDAASACWMPKARYEPMRALLERRGGHGLRMMALTATVQANFDFASEADMARKLRAAMSISPVVTALFANSFLVEGRDSGLASFRYFTWTDVDPDRCGLLPFVFENGLSYARYLAWALDVPMIFLRRDGRYLPAAGFTFRRFLAEGLHGHRATVSDFEDHLTTLFPEVRLKGVIEVRGADAGDPAMNAALPALWKGLLYDDAACEAVERLTARLSFEERLALQRDVARSALRARCAAGGVLDLAREVVEIATRGLASQPEAADPWTDERPLLEPLRAVIADGRAPADVWRERWAGELGRDLGRFVEAAAL